MITKPVPPALPPLVPLDVCHLFEKLTLDLWNAGWQHYSARAVLHQIRWHNHVTLGNRSFKCNNNNWTPALARWFMAKHQYAGDFFHTRSSPVSPVFNPSHSTEDYGGPFAMTTNNVQFLPGTRSLVTLTDSLAARKLVQEEILRSKSTYTAIAHVAGLGVSTVSNIATGRTVWPRLETIVRVLAALGWVLMAQRRGGE